MGFRRVWADRLTSKGKDMPIALVDRVHASMGRSELRGLSWT